MPEADRLHRQYGDNVPLPARLRAMDSTGERLRYLWTYYKWPFLIGLAVLIGLIFFIRDWRRGDTSLVHVTLVNCVAPAAEESELFAAFPEAYGYEGDRTVSLDDTLRINLETADAISAQAFQVLSAEFITGEIDVFVSGEDLFSRMAANGGFSDLRTQLTERQLSDWSDRLWYGSNPDTGEKEPLGIYLTDSVLYDQGIYLPEETLLLGIGGRAPHGEAAAQMAEYLIDGTN